jgi:hypothetical protein
MLNSVRIMTTSVITDIKINMVAVIKPVGCPWASGLPCNSNSSVKCKTR